MAIADSDIVFRLTETTGPSGDSNAQADPDASLGGFASTTAVDLTTTLNNLFDNISDAERVAGDVEYRAIWIANESTTDSLTTPRIWIESEVSGGASVAIGLDPEGVLPTDHGYEQGDIIATEANAPDGVTFSAPTSKSAGLEPGTIAAGSGVMLWIRRTITASTAALTGDGWTIRIEQGT